MLEHEQGFHYVDQINKVVDRGLEPPTSSMSRMRSNQLS